MDWNYTLSLGLSNGLIIHTTYKDGYFQVDLFYQSSPLKNNNITLPKKFWHIDEIKNLISTLQ